MADKVLNVRDLSLPELKDAYVAEVWLRATNAYGRPLLADALGHGDPTARAWLANRLLDDGFDPTSPAVSYLHILLGVRQRDEEVDLPLVRRLAAAGVDLNHLEPRDGRVVMAAWRYGRAALEVLFSLDGLDLTREDTTGWSVRGFARSTRLRDPWLFDRVEGYLRERGLDEPAHPAAATAWSTAQELETAYASAGAAAVREVDPATGATWLLGVLQNPDATIVETWVPRLIADGADPNARLADKRGALHLALERVPPRSAQTHASLVRSLVAAGADVNAPAGRKIGTPLNVLATLSQPEATLQEVYDALLDAPGFDPTARTGPTARSKTARDLLAKQRRPVLLERVRSLAG